MSDTMAAHDPRSLPVLLQRRPDPRNSDTPYASSDVLRAHTQPSQPQPPPPSSPRNPIGLSSVVSPSSENAPLKPRSQTITVVTNSTPNSSSIKRKPLSSAASPLATRYSSGAHLTIPSAYDLPAPETRFSRSYSLDSPTLYEYPTTLGIPKPSLASPTGQLQSSSPTNYRAEQQQHTAELVSRNIATANPAALQTAPLPVLPQYDDLTAHIFPPRTLAVPTGSIIDEDTDRDSESTYSLNSNDNPAMSIIAPKPTPPHLNLGKVDSFYNQDSETTARNSNNPPQFNKPLPKSPGSSKIGSFFAWAASPSPSTSEFSSFPSPRPSFLTDDSSISTGPPSSHYNGSKANAVTANPLGYCESNLLTPPPAVTPTPPAQIEEMEDELMGIGAELASSIRREMDLEDLVDRLQAQVDNPQAPGKRTSDYFSDSGYSSAKFSEYDQTREEVEKIQRRADQEKAQVRLELTTKLQDERSRRKALDQQIKELSERASQIDTAQMNSVGATGRVKELERTCEDLRRRLAEEKQVKNNFEDLLSALKGELRSASNERDNLRDEIVPQLRARVEGLEAEANQHVNLTYESTKMQQELQSLKQENTNLRNSKDQPSSQVSAGLTRSNSVTAGSFKLQKPPTGLARSNTVKQVESRDALSDRLKDVEAQRDALHSALKNLLERQEFQNRENEKKIKFLEVERDRLLANSPRKGGFEKDISNLRHEINVLRRRAEEAVDQKWQVEKGLGGLKMDLDRAEGEIASLRALLKEKDILIPPSVSRSSGNTSTSAVPVTSASLEAAFKDLQIAYKESLERIKKLELGDVGESDERTQLAIQRLEQSLSAAVSERDAAKQDVVAYKTQVDSLTASEAKHLEGERALADELRESARRVEELAIQVRQQLAANAGLRQRLTDTVARGDADRKANVERITGLQSRLRTLEEQLIAAQSASEDRVTRHEEQLTALKEAHNTQLRRANTSPALGGLVSPRKSSLSPMPASPLFPRSPRLPPSKSFEDEAQIASLRSKVEELERSLSQADAEMQDVVAKMSGAQIEVFTLQEERDVAVRETRRLQKVLEDEKVKSFEERFKTLSGNV